VRGGEGPGDPDFATATSSTCQPGSRLETDGGCDEFVIVLHSIDTPDQVFAVIRWLANEMARPVMIGDTPVQPSASAGIALPDGAG